MTNTTFRLAPWADALFAMDVAWWRQHFAEVAQTFRGQRYSSNRQGRECVVRHLPPPAFKAYGNSGAGAIALAVHEGARRVVLLGYDCQHTGGQMHWHGNHPRGLGNAGSVHKWPARFAELARDIAGRCQVLNATRETALTCFPRAQLEEALQ